MITTEQILQIASEHLYCNMSVVEWSGNSEDILNFARAIYEMGNDDGWESRADAEYLNSSKARCEDYQVITNPTKPAPIKQSINRVER